MANCTHLNGLTHLQLPRLSQSVHREECTQCFDDQDEPLGIDVCLSCFNGGCLGEERHHARTHVQKTGHSFTLNIRRKLKPSIERVEGKEPPTKVTKLAIVEEREDDKYDTVTTLRCWKCDPQDGLAVLPPHSSPLSQQATVLVDGIMTFMSSARQSEVKAWEEEITACEHTLTLHQSEPSQIPASGLAHCNRCDLKENLWLCMTCGWLGCGRQQYGGVGGNGHGLLHFEGTGHAVSAKLGTITPEGSADIYCYICDDTKLDPELAFHLSTFGINVTTLSKTEKTMTELNIEQNLKYEFSVVGEGGKAFDPMFGPGLTGLSNLGNSCYMASVVQMLFALPAFQLRYYTPATTSSHAEVCTAPLPADCVECQMRKLADGLLSGRYSLPAPESRRDDSARKEDAEVVFQKGLRPVGFKALVGKGHVEFATMRQQDSEEFLAHLMEVLRRDNRRTGILGKQPTEYFAYGMEQRLQCGNCKRVRYRVDKMDVVSVALPARERVVDQEKKEWEEVSLKTCLDGLTASEALEYACPSCVQSVVAVKQSRFATVPDVLVIHAKKFQLVNWVPTKLDIPLILPPSDEIVLDEYIGYGLQETEIELPDDNSSTIILPTFDAGAMATLEGMGFPTVRCQKALLATGNGGDAQAAMEWLFAHMEDPDIDAPIQLAAVSGGPEPSAEQVGMLADMGFTPAQARKALRETKGDAERAVEWLFSHPEDTGEESGQAAGTSDRKVDVGGTKELPARYRLKAFISHKGPSVHSGHYVAHVRIGADWVLFNDEKVVKAEGDSVEELKKLAYLYVFEKV